MQEVTNERGVTVGVCHTKASAVLSRSTDMKKWSKAAAVWDEIIYVFHHDLYSTTRFFGLSFFVSFIIDNFSSFWFKFFF